MNIYTLFRFIKMLYQLVVYIIHALVFGFNILWLCCFVASAAIPWITLLLIFVCIGSKFFKLKSPQRKNILQLLGQDVNVMYNNDTKCVHLMWAVANRGGAFDAPENSVEALRKCTASKCRNILFDLAMTACGELVVLHQSTLQKANILNPISSVKYESLQNFNISDHHPLGHQFPPEKIINLANLLTLLDHDDSKALFLLLSNANKTTINALKDVIARNETFVKRFIVCSRSPLAIYQLRKEFPELICGLWIEKSSIANCHNLFKTSALLRSVYGALFRNIVAPVIGISVVFIHKEEFNLHTANLWRNVGVRPIVYPVNSPNEKRYYQQVTKTQYLTDSLRSEPQILLNKIKSNDLT